jgi:hypothetical protein
MFIQIFVGSCLILLTVLVATLGFLVFKIILNRAHSMTDQRTAQAQRLAAVKRDVRHQRTAEHRHHGRVVNGSAA